MTSTYSVSIIPQNLNNGETIVQLIEVLKLLSNIAESIFQQVNTRIDSNKKALTNVSNRVNVVNAKINRLKGAKKATQIFSSSKYPAADVVREYISIFSDVEKCEMKRQDIQNTEIRTKQTTKYEPMEKLLVYHVRLSNSENDKDKLNGLGKVPSDIECFNDLLLYNSGKNLYKDFVMSDVLKYTQHVREEDTINLSVIGEAPFSITDRSSLKQSTSHNYFYSPKIGEVPALDVPLDLPDLPGIADDLRYKNEVGPAIAPSAVSQTAIDLPKIEEKQSVNRMVEVELPLPSPPLFEFDASLPPRSVRQQEKKPEPIQFSISVQPTLETPIPPPPPPPPPASQEPISSYVKPTPSMSISHTGEDARANLMEAIRKAGGAKNAKLRSTEQTEQDKIQSKIPVGDLMADLHSKLLMRRKGISGAKIAEEQKPIDGPSTLEKLSAMIPPPTGKNETTSTTEDEDWDE